MRWPAAKGGLDSTPAVRVKENVLRSWRVTRRHVWLLTLSLALLVASCKLVPSPVPVATTIAVTLSPAVTASSTPASTAFNTPNPNSAPVLRVPLGKNESAAAAWSPDGKLLAIGGWVRMGLYDTATMQLVRSIEDEAPFSGVLAFSPDGRWLASTHMDNIVCVWDVRNNQIRRSSESQYRPTTLAFSPDGTVLAVGAENLPYFGSGPGHPTELRLVQVETSLLIGTHDTGSATGGPWVTFPTNETLLIHKVLANSCSRGNWGFVELWSWDALTLVPGRQNPTPIWQRSHDGGIGLVNLSPDQRLVVATLGPPGCIGNGTVVFWDAQSGTERIALRPDYPVGSLAFGPDGSALVIGGGSESGIVRAWDVPSGRPTSTFKRHPQPVTDVHFSPDGRLLAMSSRDGTSQLWDARTGQTLRMFEGERFNVAINPFSPDGRLIVSRNRDGSVQVWTAQY